MSKVKNKETLTLALLQTEVPLVHKGNSAQEALPTATAEDKPALLHDIRAGQEAQERLIKASLSFVISLARKEKQRRAQWASTIPLEDIIQEGMAGLIKGINSYNPNVPQKSATNYLGQWITTQMRRGLESMEHSFTIPQETIERHRKIRAVRSRLEGELGRIPTDEEIVQGARESKGKFGDAKMGRINKQYSTSRARDITLAHVEEERTYSTRTGSILPTEQTFGDDDTVDNVDLANSQSLGSEDSTPEEGAGSVDQHSTTRALSQLLQATIDDINMPEAQEAIIKMKYGLPPYEEEYTVKSIISLTKVPKHKIKLIVDAFSAELTTPQSTFHKHVHSIQDDVYSMGIGWVADALGDYDESHAPNRPSRALTEPVEPRTTRKVEEGSTSLRNGAKDDYKHIYACPIHGEFIISLEGDPSPISVCNIDGCNEIAELIQ